MASVDKEKINKKKKEIIYHKKGGTTDTKQAKWTHIFSTKTRKEKKSKVCFRYKGKKKKEGRE